MAVFGTNLCSYPPSSWSFVFFLDDKGDSLSGILFRLENVKTPKETVAVLGDLIELLKNFPNAERLGHDFKLFIQHILKPATQMELPLEQMESLSEIHSCYCP